ncbi:YitT family protein [Oryzobacter terrae]|uniref:membrane protein YczE n=1 Tax=Oryzobacter terrae TaxID=1620385 RepID=UPI0036706138
MTPIQVLRRGVSRRVELVAMNPVEQLRAGRLVRRLTQLFVGLGLFGVTMALMLRAGLGLEPWGVFTYGLIQHVPMSYGQMVVASSFVILLLWIPLRQWPGLGTVANALVIGVATDLTLGVVPEVEGLGWRVLVMLVAVVGNGIAGAMYIGSQLGPGPRDGLMTGLTRRTGRSVRLVRTSIEVTVVVVGWLLGGVLGVGTLVYALLIGPVVQLFLPMLTVRVERPARHDEEAEPSVAAASDGEPVHGG